MNFIAVGKQYIVEKRSEIAVLDKSGNFTGTLKYSIDLRADGGFQTVEVVKEVYLSAIPGEVFMLNLVLEKE